jgi:hypothetical protein
MAKVTVVSLNHNPEALTLTWIIIRVHLMNRMCVYAIRLWLALSMYENSVLHFTVILARFCIRLEQA